MSFLYPLRCAVLAAIAICLAVGGAEASRWGRSYVPNVPVVTQDGRVLQFYDDLIKDKVFVISFLFTSCRDICPLAVARLAQAQQKLGDRMGRDVFFYSISIDPERDTPERLKKYAETFGAGPGWTFLTGAPEDIKLIRDRLGERSRFLGEHRNDVLLGNGFTGEWQRDSAMGDLERFIMTIHAMNEAGPGRQRDTAKSEPRLEGYALTGPAGEPLFLKACAGCHTIGGGDRVGPDLSGISRRRQRDWLTRFIADPDKMRKAKDPIALALSAKFPVVRMPGLGVSEDEAADLVTYIESRDAKGSPPALVEALLPLTTQDGVRLDRGAVAGRPVVVVFGFTHCPDVCPTTLLEWSNVLERLGPQGDETKVLFVSVDGERDRPAALKSYLAAFDRRIIGLTGSGSEIAAAAKAFDAFYERVESQSGTVTYDHTVKAYLIGRDGRLASTFDPQSEEAERVGLLRRLLAE
jgi:protein SCO1/2